MVMDLGAAKKVDVITHYSYRNLKKGNLKQIKKVFSPLFALMWFIDLYSNFYFSSFWNS